MFKDSRTFLVEENPPNSEGSWWKRRTKLEKKLFVLIFVLLLKCALFGAVFCWLYIMYRSHTGFFETKAERSQISVPLPTAVAALSTPYSEENICLKPGCVKAASTIIDNMNPEASPCDDFYEYACGGFIDCNYIPDSKRRIGQFSIIAEDLSQQIKEIIDSPVDEEDSKLLKNMKDFYVSCMNETKIKEIGLEPLQELVKKIGGWPVVMGDQWNDNGFQWQELMFRFKDADVSPNSFLSFGVTEDFINSTKYILTVSSPGLSLPKSYYKQGMNNSYVKAYFDYLVQAAVFFGADRKRAKKEMTDVMQMEMELSELLPSSDRVSNVSKLYMRTNLSSLQEMAPGLNWKSYLERILPVEFDENEMIYVLSQNYTLNFTKVLRKISPRTLANFAVGRVVRALASVVSEEFAQLSFKAFKKVSGVKTRSARWRMCLSKTRTMFSAAISHEYIDKWFSDEEKSKANEMVKLIKEEMMEMLRNVKWADPVTLQKAVDKLSEMDAVVAYPEEVLNYDKVAQIYENFTVDAGAYFQNIRNYQKLQRDKHFSKLYQPVKKHEWKKSSEVAVVNAYYSPLENIIILPAGILQGVFFNYERPEYMNFASIGAIIGHEITHGFDDRGRQFNKYGRLQNWWEPETNKKFKELTKCLILQYNNYISPEVNMSLNGKNCLGENIADNGGLKNAYHAYQRWVQKHGNEPRLPGLNLTTNQLFWMSYANIWCSKARSESIKEQIEFGFHTISRFRVNGPLSNMPEFARDFNCPLYSNMNPNERCAVW